MFGALLGAAGGIAKGIMGAVQASKARKAIDSYDRQELTNAYEGVGVSTKAQEYAQKQLAQSGATAMQDIKASGVRGVVGAVPNMVGGMVDSAAKIGAEIDTQIVDLENKKAAETVRIQGMQEEREKADLAGLGQQLAVGQQNTFSGIADVAQAGGAIAAMGTANKEAGLGFWGNK